MHLDNHKHNPFKKKQIAVKSCEFHFLKCSFKGNDVELEQHMEESQKNHLHLVCNYLSCKSPLKPNSVIGIGDNDLKYLMSSEIKEKLGRKESKENELQVAEIQGKQKDITFQLTGVKDLLATLQESIIEINRSGVSISARSVYHYRILIICTITSKFEL